MNNDDIVIEYEKSSSLKVLMGREPILDRQQKLVGHEIIFRSSNPDLTRQAADTNSILEQTAESGIENLVGDSMGCITATEAFLFSESVLFLPQKNFFIVLHHSLAASDALLARIAELRRQGFKFALNQTQMLSPEKAAFLPLVDIIRIVLPPPPQVLIFGMEQLRMYKTGQKKLFALNVWDMAQFEHCVQLGFDYFSGNFYTKPIFLKDRKFTASELTIVKALELINSDASDQEIELAIKRDAVIGIKILKHVNSAAAGARQRIGSLKQAIQMIGHAQLKHWLQVMLYEKSDNQPCGAALFTLATTRGKLLELLAKKQLPNNRAASDIGFIVGLMSLMDTLFSMPMEEVLQKIPVYNEVSLALLERKSVYGKLLRLIENLEQLAQSPQELLPLLAELDLAPEDLYDLQQQTFVWVSRLA
jgi:EAL and modified HD-GYP domain-containing signal transduction protein